MSDPRSEAVATVDRLLAEARRAPLNPAGCEALLGAVGLVPGRQRAVVAALAAQRDAAAVDALLRLPPNVPGTVEGIFGAIASGVTRRRFDGSAGAYMLAIDFRRSRSKSFPALAARAHRVFGKDFERLDVGGDPRFRVGIFEGPGTFAGRVAAKAQDIHWLHERLGKLKGTRLWINGWCLPMDGPWRAPIQTHLLRAWLSWAAGQTQTKTTSQAKAR